MPYGRLTDQWNVCVCIWMYVYMYPYTEVAQRISQPHPTQTTNSGNNALRWLNLPFCLNFLLHFTILYFLDSPFPPPSSAWGFHCHIPHSSTHSSYESNQHSVLWVFGCMGTEKKQTLCKIIHHFAPTAIWKVGQDMHCEQIKTIFTPTYPGPQKGHLSHSYWPGLDTSLFSLSKGSEEPPAYINYKHLPTPLTLILKMESSSFSTTAEWPWKLKINYG